MKLTEHPRLSETDKLCLAALAGVLVSVALTYELTDGAAVRTAEADKPPAQTVTIPAPVIDYTPLVKAMEAPQEPQEPEEDLETLFALARTVWGEARGCTTTEQAAVVWCVLNRVDRPEWPDDPLSVVEQPGQFSGYDPEHPVWPEILAVVEDVLDRWELEKTAGGDVGRVLPKEYVFFEGDGRHNYFRTEYRGGDVWDWGLESPYENDADTTLAAAERWGR